MLHFRPSQSCCSKPVRGEHWIIYETRLPKLLQLLLTGQPSRSCCFTSRMLKLRPVLGGAQCGRTEMYWEGEVKVVCWASSYLCNNVFLCPKHLCGSFITTYHNWKKILGWVAETRVVSSASPRLGTPSFQDPQRSEFDTWWVIIGARRPAWLSGAVFQGQKNAPESTISCTHIVLYAGCPRCLNIVALSLKYCHATLQMSGPTQLHYFPT